MNIANKLTVFRVVLIPFFVLFMLTDFWEYNRWAAFGIFVVATITDKLDGSLARKYNLVSNFGKFMDPIADKLLVCSALICLSVSGEIPAWVSIIIIAREFIISGIRLIASDNGVAIAATWWGKSKTISQMAMIIIILLNIPLFYTLGQIVMYISVVLTIVSAIDYIAKNKSVITFGDM